MLKDILPQQAVAFVERERELLGRVRAFCERFDPAGSDLPRVDGLLRHLDDMFLLVVVGEVKAGKSSFINALLRADLCPEGPIPLTDKIHVLGYGPSESQEAAEPYVLRRTAPVEALRRMNVVDTPGTNSPLRRHQEITESFLPRADIVFFVTSIDCPLTRTELTLLGEIRRRYQKEVACVLAKIDMHPEKDRAVVLEYLRNSFPEHLGFEPPIFPVSARLAREAHAKGDAALLEASGFAAVERYVVENLSESRKVLLKLKSPLGAVLDLLQGVDASASTRARVLDEDFAGWRTIEEQVQFAATAIPERAERRLAPIFVAFENLEARGRAFLLETFRLRGLRRVADARGFREAFDREVVRGALPEVEAKVEEAARWLGEETRGLWERSLRHFREKVAIARYQDEVLAGAGPSFEATREETLRGIVAAARGRMEGWSVEGECARIRDLATGGVARLLGTEALAAGLGATVAATLLPSILGGVGIALAAMVALGGLFLLPARRIRAVENFEAGVRSARDAVLLAVRSAVQEESARASTAVLDAFAPFRDFYEARRRALDAVRTEGAALRDEALRLRTELE